MTYISCFSDFAFYFYYYFMENCHTWIIISKWQNDLHTNTSRSVWPILYGLMIKMLQYKMYPAGELAVLRQLLFNVQALSSKRLTSRFVFTSTTFSSLAGLKCLVSSPYGCQMSQKLDILVPILMTKLEKKRINYYFLCILSTCKVRRITHKLNVKTKFRPFVILCVLFFP